MTSSTRLIQEFLFGAVKCDHPVREINGIEGSRCVLALEDEEIGSFDQYVELLVLVRHACYVVCICYKATALFGYRFIQYVKANICAGGNGQC